MQYVVSLLSHNEYVFRAASTKLTSHEKRRIVLFWFQVTSIENDAVHVYRIRP
jgi:hypothetical protein